MLDAVPPFRAKAGAQDDERAQDLEAVPDQEIDGELTGGQRRRHAESSTGRMMAGEEDETTTAGPARDPRPAGRLG
jgi:hypothetical protein